MIEWRDRLLVSSNPSNICDGHEYWVWDGIAWESLPPVSLRTSAEFKDCSAVYQVAVVEDDILVWDDETYFTKVYRKGEWVEVDRIPAYGGSALVLDDRVLIPSGTQGHIFDPETDKWTTVSMPTLNASGEEWVWTGSKILAWRGDQPRDAWRWTPPE